MLISPRFVRKTVPRTPMKSPRSSSLKDSYTASPTLSRRTKSWIRPDESCRSAKLAPPWSSGTEPSGQRHRLAV